MTIIIARITNAALGPPSVAKAILWSLGIHVSALAATWAWRSSAVDAITLAGMRNVVQVETSFAEIGPESSDQAVVHFEQNEPLPEPFEYAIEQRSVETPTPLSSEHLPLTKREVVADVRRIQPPEVPSQLSDASQFAVRIEAKPRRAADSPDDPTDIPTVEAVRKLPRRQADVLLPQASVAAQQVAGVDDKTPPDFSGNRPPAYPATAIARRLEGTVLLRLHITATGRVRRVEIVASSGHAALDRAAVEAVSTWRGRPAQQAGRSLASIELLPVRFRL